MAVLGVQMLMLKEQVAEQGMFAVLQRLAAMDLHAVEVSQIPMDEKNTADLERGTKELGVKVGALSVALQPGPTPRCRGSVAAKARGRRVRRRIQQPPTCERARGAEPPRDDLLSGLQILCSGARRNRTIG